MKTLFFLSVVIFFLFGCGGGSKLQNHTYMYEVTGTGNLYNVEFENVDGNQTSLDNVRSGWTYKWKESHSGQFPSRLITVRAQNMDPSGCTTTVKIYKDGKIIQSNTSSGVYVIARCEIFEME